MCKSQANAFSGFNIYIYIYHKSMLSVVVCDKENNPVTNKNPQLETLRNTREKMTKYCGCFLRE